MTSLKGNISAVEPVDTGVFVQAKISDHAKAKKVIYISNKNF